MSERRSVFLERQSYRRRRLIDLVRMVPLIGLFLWAVPLLWGHEGEAAVSTSTAMIYIFGVWFLLVLGTGILSRQVRKSRADEIQE